MNPSPDARHESVISKRLFWLTFTAASLLSTLSSFWESAAWVPSVLAGTVMMAFLMASYRLTPTIVKHDDFPDGFYYLGFLLTLVALVVALVRIDPNSTTLLKTVLSQFGLALTTTILGLAVRTALTMYRSQDSSVALQPLIDEIEKAAEDLQYTLRMSATDMRTTMGQVSLEFTGVWSELSSGLASAGADITTALSTAAETVATSTGKLELALGTIGVQAHKSGSALTSLNESLDSLVEGTAQLHGTLDESREKVEAVVSSLSAGVGSVGQLGPALKTTTEHFESLASVVQTVTQRQRELLATLASIGAAQSQVGTFVKELEPLATADHVARLATALQESGANVGAFAQAARDASAGLDVFSRLPETMGIPEFQAVADMLKIQTRAIQQSVSEWQGAVEALTTTSNELHAGQRDASRALLAVNDDLAAGVKFLRSTLTPSDDA